jgi:lipoyl(octanoyl) transferase
LAPTLALPYCFPIVRWELADCPGNRKPMQPDGTSQMTLFQPPSLEWRIEEDLVPYPIAVAKMEDRVAAIRAGTAPEMVWLLEHPPIYTAGTSADPAELLDPDRFPVFRTGRGGRYTYHGPGQRVAYVMLDLQRRGGDVRGYVRDLEAWLIATLAAFNVRGERREGRVGIWVERPSGLRGGGREDKIGAIGVRVRRWVTYHGISLNVEPDLSHFAGIVPCGIGDDEGHGVTSLVDLGLPITMPEVDGALRAAFAQVFGGAAAPRPAYSDSTA